MTKAATARRAGEKQRSCSVCGYQETREIPALGGNSHGNTGSSTGSTGGDTAAGTAGSIASAKTGDSGSFLLWSVLLLAGALGLACMTRRRRKWEP